MILSRLLRRSPRRAQAHLLYAAIVAAARRPVLYADYGVADTIDGRFDMVALHAFLAMNRLAREAGPGRALAQDLADQVFRDMDRSLREMGVGDLSVARHARRMAEVFYGRLAAYDRALKDADPKALEQAVTRNVFPDGGGRPGRLAGYVLAAHKRLERASLDDLEAGRAVFGEAVP